MRAPLLEVEDPRGHPGGVKRYPQRVGRRLEELGRHALGQRAERVVGRHQVVVAVDDDRRIRLVRAQEAIERLVDGGHLRLRQRPLGIQRRVAGGEQQRVAFAERYVEVVGQAQHHLPARARPPCLDEADVA